MLNKSVAFRIICASIRPSIFGEMQQIQKLNTSNCRDIWIEFIVAARKRNSFNVTSCDILGNKRPTRCNRLVFYCKTYCSLNMFSGTIMPIIRSSIFIQMVTAYGTWRFGLQVVGLVWSCGLCVQFAGCCSTAIQFRLYFGAERRGTEIIRVRITFAFGRYSKQVPSEYQYNALSLPVKCIQIYDG